MEAQEKLRRLRNQGTRYEFAMRNPDGRCYLVVYSWRKGRRAVRSIFADRERLAWVLAILGIDFDTFSAQARCADRAADGATCGDWRFTWTGRTEREAICADPLPFIREVANSLVVTDSK